MHWTVRVTLTDGSPEKRYLLKIWATRTGVHATVAGHDLHTSYHSDGRRHVTGAPEKDEHGRRLYLPVKITQETPLVDLVGVKELQVADLHNVPLHFGDDSAFPPLGQRRGKAWEIDGRALKAGTRYQVIVGIVGSGGRAALDQHIADLTRDGKWVLARAEMGAQSSATPYLIVLCSTTESPPGASDWASSSDAATLTDGQPMTFYAPPEFRVPLGQPKRKPTVWPPVPCEHSVIVTYEFFPDAEPFVPVPSTGMRLAVPWHEPNNPCVFELFVNPQIAKTDDQGNTLYRFPSMRPAVAYRLCFGAVGNADVMYKSDEGQTFYIRCRGAGWQRKESYDQVSYRFEIQWNDPSGSYQTSAG